MEDTMITLENGINYYIIDDLDYEGRKFVIGSIVYLDEQELQDDNFLIKEIVKNGDQLVVIDIEDDQLAAEVTRLLIAKIQTSDH